MHPVVAKAYLKLLKLILSVASVCSLLVTTANNDPGTWFVGHLKLLKYVHAYTYIED